MNETTMNTTRAMHKVRPDFAIYHPNGENTGCAFRMNLHPAHDDRDGCIMMELANQMSVGNHQGPKPTYATFNWKGSLAVKLGFSDICKMIQVFRGTLGSLEGGKGLFHRSARYMTKICLSHIMEPVDGYLLEIYRNPLQSMQGTNDSSRARILLNTWEALGLSLAFENSIGIVCFGIPKVVTRESAAVGGESAMGGSRDVPAA